VIVISQDSYDHIKSCRKLIRFYLNTSHMCP